MSDDGDRRWFVRHADLLYKLLLLVLAGMWIALPPQASQPSVAKPQTHVMIGQAR